MWQEHCSALQLDPFLPVSAVVADFLHAHSKGSLGSAVHWWKGVSWVCRHAGLAHLLDNIDKAVFLACHGQDTGLIGAIPSPTIGGKHFQVADAFLTVPQREPTKVVLKDALMESHTFGLGKVLPGERAGAQWRYEAVTELL